MPLESFNLRVTESKSSKKLGEFGVSTNFQELVVKFKSGTVRVQPLLTTLMGAAFAALIPTPVALIAVMPRAPAPTATTLSEIDIANAIALETIFLAVDLIMGIY